MSRAAQYDQTGGPEVLSVGDVPDEEPGAGQVRVRVHAAGINPFDAKVRSGFIPMQTPFPRRIGSDLAGVVEATGDGATYWDGSAVQVGDEVLGSGRGSVAETAIASAANLARRPEGVPVEVVGALYVTGLTAVSCLATVPVDGSDTVLVGGAAGGVGIVAAQLARAAGARVIGTASERNHELLRSLGIEPMVYGDGLAERVAALGELTAVMDCHGRDALDVGVALGVPRDRMVAIAAYAALEELGVLNVEREARTAKNLAGLADRIAAGDLVTPIAGSFPLDQVADAFRALESPATSGRVVVTA